MKMGFMIEKELQISGKRRNYSINCPIKSNEPISYPLNMKWDFYLSKYKNSIPSRLKTSI